MQAPKILEKPPSPPHFYGCTILEPNEQYEFLGNQIQKKKQ
jgi:hypothetical protein